MAISRKATSLFPPTLVVPTKCHLPWQTHGTSRLDTPTDDAYYLRREAFSSSPYAAQAFMMFQDWTSPIPVHIVIFFNGDWYSY